jgi:hypothetical protein
LYYMEREVKQLACTVKREVNNWLFTVWKDSLTTGFALFGERERG